MKNLTMCFILLQWFGREIIENNPLIVSEDLSIDSHFWKWCITSRPGKVICFSSSACYPINLQTYL